MPKSSLKTVQAVLTGLSIIFSIIAVVSVSWVGTEIGNTGIFSYKVGNTVKDLNCNSMMSQTQCGYLQSSQNATIISIIFCFLTFAWLLNQYSHSSAMNSLIAFGLSFLQFCFGVTGVVVYSYFKDDYLEADDGVNVEYPVATHANYLYGFYFMISVVTASFVVAGISGMEVYTFSRGTDGGSNSKGMRHMENN